MSSLLVTALFLLTAHVNCSQNLSFLLLTSSSSEFNTSGVISAVELALKDVLQDSILLDHYMLQYTTVIDSKCNRDHTLEVLRQQLTNTTVAVIGCGCSNATQAITDLPSKLKSIPVISYSSLSTILSNSTLYPSLIRVVPSYSQLPNALAQFISHFGWKQILLITQQIAATKEEFMTALNSHNIVVEVYSEWNHLLSDSIFLTRKRVFVLDVAQSNAKSILCQAFLNGKYYPGHAWIVIDNYAMSRWWGDHNNCTNEQLETVLNYSLVIGIHSSTNDTLSLYGGYAYDAVWTLALALNETINTDNTLSVDSFHEISFNGVTGPISFNEGERQDVLLYYTQLISNKGDILSGQHVANFNYTSLQLKFINSTVNIWPLGVPSDGIPLTTIVTVPIPVFVFAVIMTTIGLTWTVICFVFNIVFRKAKVIQLTSPKLNYVMILGSLFVYVSLILYTLPIINKTTVEALCSIRTFIASVIGYDLCISLTTVKIWRIYYIVVNPRPSKKIPKDSHLLIVVGFLVSLEFVFAAIFIGLDGIFSSPELVESAENKRIVNETTGEEQIFYFWDCRESTYGHVYTVGTIIYKFALHCASLYFAFRLRKIKITVLNEYKSTAAITYSSIVFMVAAGISLPIIQNQYLTAYYLTYVILVFILVTLFLSFTFVPKMIALWRDPKGENVFAYQQEEVHEEAADHGSKERHKASSNSDGDTSTNPTVVVKHTVEISSV